MTEKKISELVHRYELMLQESTHCYFDADELDEIAFQYELDDQFQKALDVIEYGLVLHPQNSDLTLKRIKYLLRLDRIDDAEKLLNAISLDSDAALLLQAELFLIQGELDSALSVIDTLFNSNDFELETCFDIMDLLLDFSSVADVAKLVEKAIAIFPKGEFDLYRELGAIYESKELYSEAISIYNKLLDKDPYSVTDWFNLAKVLALQKEYFQAVEACDFALSIQENDETLLSFKGYCYYDAAVYDKAAETFKELLEVSTDKSTICELIAECYTKSGKNEAAINYLQLAIGKDPNNSNLYYQQATNYFDGGDREKAYEMLRKTVALNPTDYDAIAFMGEIHLLAKEIPEALLYLHKAYDMMPKEENEELLMLLGDTYSLIPQYEESESYYLQALEKNKYNVKVLFKLMVLYLNLENQEKVAELISLLEGYSEQIEELNDLTEENKRDLKEVKRILDILKNILNDSME